MKLLKFIRKFLCGVSINISKRLRDFLRSAEESVEFLNFLNGDLILELGEDLLDEEKRNERLLYISSRIKSAVRSIMFFSVEFNSDDVGIMSSIFSSVLSF